MLVRDQNGAVFGEYVTILVLVAIGCAAGVVGLGVPLYNLYLFQVAILLLPLP
jgi:Flp pilus assembly pilin Flp